MPIYEITCSDCEFKGELIVVSQNNSLQCPKCGSKSIKKLMSATSSLTGKTAQQFPGPGDTACCGKHPAESSCAGPGSCCGKAF